MSTQTIIQLLGGVGIFLFAIKLISDSLQLMAGDRLRQLIGAITKTPVLGVFMGALVTVLIQSSSATTVMTVSFVDAGLMGLNQAIGVIMGANIGTTITGQIIAIKVKDYAYLFIILGVLLSFFGRSKIQKYAGGGLIGFGLLFVGMQTMESSMAFLRTRQDIFITFSTHPLLGVLAGTVLTLLVQSSSATVGLTIALGMQGVLPLEAAIPIILGDNIGTTITAILAAIGTKRAAQQACMAHVLFNVLGVCLFLPFLPLYTQLISHTAETIGHQIANAHTLFNVTITLIFLPFVNIFALCIRKIFPDVAAPEERIIQYLDKKLIASSPAAAVQAVKNESLHMGMLTVQLLDAVRDVYFNNRPQAADTVYVNESSADLLKKAIREYAQGIWQAGVSDETAHVLEQYMRCSNDIERVSDKGKSLIRFWEYKKQENKMFSEEAMQEIDELFTCAQNNFSLALDSVQSDDPHKADAVRATSKRLRAREVELRGNHIRRMDAQLCSPEGGLIFADMLKTIESISYHAANIARVTLDTTNKK